jgi:hypothetical protein
MSEGCGLKPPGGGGGFRVTNSGIEFKPNPRHNSGEGDKGSIGAALCLKGVLKTAPVPGRAVLVQGERSVKVRLGQPSASTPGGGVAEGYFSEQASSEIIPCYDQSQRFA